MKLNQALNRRQAAAALACGVPAVLLPHSAGAVTDGWARASMLTAEAAYLAAWNRHDAEAVAAACHPEGVRWTPANEAGLRGPAILADARSVFAIYPDFRVEDVKVEVIDDTSLVKTFVFKGSWTGRFPGGPLADKEPSGRPFAVSAVELLEIRDARIVSSRAYFDRLSLLLQIGAIGL